MTNQDYSKIEADSMIRPDVRPPQRSDPANTSASAGRKDPGAEKYPACKHDRVGAPGPTAWSRTTDGEQAGPVILERRVGDSARKT
jgi:hypothetical protein